MQVKTNITRTYDILGLDEERYKQVKAMLGGHANSTNKHVPTKTVTVKTPKQPRATKSSTRPSVTIKCPIGGEPISKQGAWHHVQKHGGEKGMTKEASRAAYRKAVEAVE